MVAGVDPDEWRKLLGQANSGQLSLDPETGKGLDQVCDAYLDRLDGIMRTADGVKFITGFGSFKSGEDLQTKFTAKGSGTPQSIDAVLQQHIDVVKTAKEVVAKAISNFIETDRQNATRISKSGDQQ